MSLCSPFSIRSFIDLDLLLGIARVLRFFGGLSRRRFQECWRQTVSQQQEQKRIEKLTDMFPVAIAFQYGCQSSLRIAGDLVK